MKKFLVGIILSSSFLLFAACGSTVNNSDSSNSEMQESVASQTNPENSDDSSTNQSVEVDKGLLTVSITLPASFFEDDDDSTEITQESLEESITDDDGFKSVTLNDDGSVTYVMTKNKQKEMLEDMAENIEEALQKAIDSDDYTFTQIEHNSDFTQFTVTLSGNEPNLTESFYVINLYLQGAYYNMMAGNEDYDVLVDFVNSDTGDTVYEGSYKDWISSFEEDTEASETAE